MKITKPQNINKNDILFVDNDTLLKDNIGNKRFIIVLGIFRKKFLDLLREGKKVECDKIVKTIVDCICNKAVPNGHFIEYSKKKQAWHDIGDGELARLKVRKCLLNNISTIELKANSHMPSTKPHISPLINDLKETNDNAYPCIEKEAGKLNLGNERFEIKDPYLVDNASILRGRKIITAKIRRNYHKKAVIKKEVNLKKQVSLHKIAGNVNKITEHNNTGFITRQKDQICSHQNHKRNTIDTCKGKGISEDEKKAGIIKTHVSNMVSKTLDVAIDEYRKKNYSYNSNNHEIEQILQSAKNLLFVKNAAF